MAAEAAEAGCAWRERTLRLSHRYLYGVEVLIAGCGWETDRSREILRSVGGEAPLRALLQREWHREEEVAQEVARCGCGRRASAGQAQAAAGRNGAGE